MVRLPWTCEASVQLTLAVSLGKDPKTVSAGDLGVTSVPGLGTLSMNGMGMHLEGRSRAVPAPTENGQPASSSDHDKSDNARRVWASGRALDDADDQDDRVARLCQKRGVAKGRVGK